MDLRNPAMSPVDIRRRALGSHNKAGLAQPSIRQSAPSNEPAQTWFRGSQDWQNDSYGLEIFDNLSPEQHPGPSLIHPLQVQGHLYPEPERGAVRCEELKRWEEKGEQRFHVNEGIMKKWSGENSEERSSPKVYHIRRLADFLDS